MSDKLLVSLWGLSISAEGLWAIGAATIIVGIVVTAIVFIRSGLSKLHSIGDVKKDHIP